MAQNKRRPRTGEKRTTNQPLKIDRLPLEVRDAILFLRNSRFKTWEEIEELSAEKYDPDWQKKGGGFVHWEELPTPVLELFPDLRIPHTNLHRWYDLRVTQVTAETLRRSAQARELAAAFAKSVVEGADEAVLNAARDQLMYILAEDTDQKARLTATKGLIALAEVQKGVRANTIKERKVAVDERRIKALEAREELARRKLEAEADRLQKKAAKGQITPEDLARLTERTFGFKPRAEGAQSNG